MKREIAEAWQASERNGVSGVNSDAIVYKGCCDETDASAGWVKEFRHQRECAVLRWLLGRA